MLKKLKCTHSCNIMRLLQDHHRVLQKKSIISCDRYTMLRHCWWGKCVGDSCEAHGPHCLCFLLCSRFWRSSVQKEVKCVYCWSVRHVFKYAVSTGSPQFNWESGQKHFERLWHNHKMPKIYKWSFCLLGVDRLKTDMSCLSP